AADANTKTPPEGGALAVGRPREAALGWWQGVRHVNDATLEALAPRVRWSQCGKQAAEVVAVARPRPRDQVDFIAVKPRVATQIRKRVVVGERQVIPIGVDFLGAIGARSVEPDLTDGGIGANDLSNVLRGH